MEEKEAKLVLDSFSGYYKSAEITVPSIEQREFGVGGFRKKIEGRHMGFGTNGMLHNYLVQDTPLYISHSIAYYKFPEATPMENKEWMGGDLVFDLDVHAGMFLSEAEIEGVKNDAVSLLEDFLIEDFGVEKKDTLLVFSGGRGFHIHIKSPQFRDLGGDERRELADYVGGVGLNYEKFFEAPDENKRVWGPRKTDWGYRGRFCRFLEKVLDDDPSSIHRGLKKPQEKAKLHSCMEDGNWSKTPIKDIIPRLRAVAERMKIGTINVDSGVTIDTKRLIRVPGTLHGSTGLIAKKLDKIEGFHPYHDAIAFGSEPLKIRVLENIGEQEFCNSTMGKMEKGEEKEVPMSYGIYLLLKGAATLS
ncbi:DNA primase catalytic subunit PriS [Candidatus Micrarchaeota archaeon]|nr:DNA primase catalytic subunit PriS [Candidatus Micrarchaeota archaeon]